jgi:site-specific recombinase XerD
MDNLQIRFVFDRKRQATNTKKGLLQIEVRIQRTSKKVFISTGIHLLANQFSDKNGFVCKNHNNSILITGKATRIFREIEAFCLSEKCISILDVKNWNKNESDVHSFIEFMKTELRKRNPTWATIDHHNVLIRRLEEFEKIKTFSDLTYKNISDFDGYLRKKIKSSATLNKRHCALRQYIRQAINMDLLKKDPYSLFKMPPKKSKEPVFLEENEIYSILKYETKIEKLEHARDLFIFQIFTGLAYIDMVKFDNSSVVIVEGKKIIKSNRQKTDESFISLLLPEAEKILIKYAYKLPIISNQKYNDYLKLLQAGSGISKNLTSHVARHTYATYLLNKGIPLHSVSRAMGHSSTRMTEHYAKLLGRTVIDDMSKLL